jgi:hypothetical protein
MFPESTPDLLKMVPGDLCLYQVFGSVIMDQCLENSVLNTAWLATSGYQNNQGNRMYGKITQ